MTEPGGDYLARKLADFERRLQATERATRLQYSSVGIPVDDTDDAAVVDLAVGSGLWTGVEAYADASTALDKVARAARTYNQDTAPSPGDEPDLTIPAGSLWNNTADGNAQYRWSSAQTWIPVPFDTGTLTPQLLALIRMRFADEAERDALIPFPEVGMNAYLRSTGITYQYSQYGWTPLVQYIKKPSNTTITGSGIVDLTNPDPHLRPLLVPGTYRVQAVLHYTTPNAAGFRTQWVFSGTVVTGNRSCLGPAPGSTDPAAVSQMRSSGHNYATSVSYGGGSTATLVQEDLLMRVDQAGVLSLGWAQGVSNSGDTTLSAASRVFVDKLADTL